MTAGSGHAELQEFLEHRPVGKTGQVVVIGQEGHLFLGLLPLGDVEHHAVDERR
jgi:hypothetical protein